MMTCIAGYLSWKTVGIWSSTTDLLDQNFSPYFNHLFLHLHSIPRRRWTDILQKYISFLQPPLTSLPHNQYFTDCQHCQEKGQMYNFSVNINTAEHKSQCGWAMRKVKPSLRKLRVLSTPRWLKNCKATVHFKKTGKLQSYWPLQGDWKTAKLLPTSRWLENFKVMVTRQKLAFNSIEQYKHSTM